ncbi:hypothetical protein BH11ACT8_BH11ACT8_35880 [soil metagenome]
MMNRILVGVLVAVALTASTTVIQAGLTDPAGAASSSRWGQAAAKDQTIKRGCRDYPFHYRINAPGDAWMAEMTLVNPNGRKVGTHTFESAEDRASDRATFELCKATTRPGRYRIAMKVTSYDARTASTRRAKPATFRLEAR